MCRCLAPREEEIRDVFALRRQKISANQTDPWFKPIIVLISQEIEGIRAGQTDKCALFIRYT
jgi:hypothetical protein